MTKQSLAFLFCFTRELNPSLPSPFAHPSSQPSAHPFLDTVFDNSILFRKNDQLRITYFRIPGVPGLHFVPWHRGSGCLGASAPVTGAAADEHNLNVVDCDESVTVARLSSIPVLKWGSGGTPSRRRQT
jgi:hypothetical protein